MFYNMSKEVSDNRSNELTRGHCLISNKKYIIRMGNKNIY